MSIIKTIIQATNDIEDIKITNYDHIKPKAIDNFLKMLCVLKIKELSNRFKAVEIQGKVSHKKFMNLMNEIFNDSYIYQSLYELIFSRFKLMKCSVLSHKEKSFMTKIISEDEISAYEICCALAIFIKCEFKEKMKLLFDLTDIDEDGFLNEEEIIRFITTLNYLFCHEEKPIPVSSTIINQSLANIKIKESLDMLMHEPGELKKLLNSEIYIDFEMFYERLTKIPFYKFKVIPCFVNFRTCLNVDKQEQNIVVTKRIRDDFVKVSNELLTSIKLTPNENQDLKFKYPSRKLPNKELNDNTNNNTHTNSNRKNTNTKKVSIKINSNNIINNNNKPITNNTSSLNTNANTINSNTTPNVVSIPTEQSVTRRKSTAVMRFKSSMRNLIFKGMQDKHGITCYYNKVRNMEIYPAVIKVIDDRKNTVYDNTPYETDYARRLNHFKQKEMYKELMKKHYRYLTKSEILSEIEMLSNKHKGEEYNEQMMIDINVDVGEEAAKMRNSLKEKNKYDNNLTFGKYKDIKISIK